jgi:hypothetical protein
MSIAVNVAETLENFSRLWPNFLARKSRQSGKWRTPTARLGEIFQSEQTLKSRGTIEACLA